jgi:hypothetical protein
MTSFLTILPLSLSLLGVSHSPKELSFEATEEPIASPRFVLVEIPVLIAPTFDNAAPDADRIERESKPQQGWTPLPRPGVPEPIQGDLTFDSVINSDDLLEMLNQWGACPELIDVGCAADLNGDQAVNEQDLMQLMRLWNQGDAASS